MSFSPSSALRRAGLASALILLASGCATLDVSSQYQAPQAIAAPASERFDRPFEEVWAKLVRRLSQSFFHVDQVEKASRFISLSVRDEQLDGFVTCGEIEYLVNGRTWRFDPAADSKLDESSYMKGLEVTHETHGRVGRMNIFVAPEGNGTIVEVNASFELEMIEHGQSVQNDFMGRPDTSATWEETRAKFRLTTTEPASGMLGPREITCQSTRAWETKVLDLAR